MYITDLSLHHRLLQSQTLPFTRNTPADQMPQSSWSQYSQGSRGSTGGLYQSAISAEPPSDRARLAAGMPNLPLQLSSWFEGSGCGWNSRLPPPASDTAGRRVCVAVAILILFEARHAGWSFAAWLVPFWATDKSALLQAVRGGPAQLQTGRAGYDCINEPTGVNLLLWAPLVLCPHLLGIVDYRTQR
ncbi:hypothetical protein EYF80_008080 [Liparis tanakae]|uniref:Uncharacterized protein n=1 Tax=Liparis tanakae TaxID=230148 RepID=A0A4Z2IVR2_9TELE|nr:hypothetical protein EYF80_008080 [Liparis tanakae]